jgi:hypothetical protein
MKSQKVESQPQSEKPSSEYLRIGSLPGRELEKLMLRGELPDGDKLAGYEFRGMNVSDVTRLIGIKKFIKGFYKSDATSQLFGYNIPVLQTPTTEPWEKKPGARPFGFYRVDPVDAAARDNAYLGALLLDYGRGGNHELDPTSRIRDYLVRVERGSDELLLGKAYLAVGPLRPAIGFFVLERLRASDFRR